MPGRPSRWAPSPACRRWRSRAGCADGGRLTCFDISEEYTAIARRYWERAGVDDRIELRIGPAAETLRELPHEPHLDFAFIDADKTGYPMYWAELVPRMRPGGVIAVDNVLRDGRVLAPQSDSRPGDRRVQRLTCWPTCGSSGDAADRRRPDPRPRALTPRG